MTLQHLFGLYLIVFGITWAAISAITHRSDRFLKWQAKRNTKMWGGSMAKGAINKKVANWKSQEKIVYIVLFFIVLIGVVLLRV